MLAMIRGGGGGGSSSLGRRLQSRRGGAGHAPNNRLVSPLVIVLAGMLLSLCLMALGWSVIVHHHVSSVNLHDKHKVSMQNQQAPMPVSMLRSRLHHGYADAANANSNVRHPLKTDLLLPTPIIVVGLPKAGTTSLTSYFRCGGIRSSHFSCEVNDDDDLTRPWRNCILPKGAGGARSDVGTQPLCSVCIERNIVRGRPPLEGCGSYEVFGEIDSAEHPLPMLRVDDGSANWHDTADEDANDGNENDDDKIQPLCSFPQITHLEKIHASYPNATFILNTRPVHRWIQSISNWNPTPNRADKGYLRRVLTQCDLGPTFGPGVGETDEELTEFYLGHSERIRQFVREHPSHTLVEVDIEDEQAGDTMQKAFGINKQCWGKQNAADPPPAAAAAASASQRASPRILGQPQGDVHVATSSTAGTAKKHNLTTAIAESRKQAELLFSQYSAQKQYNAETALDYPYCSDIEDIFPRKTA